MVLNESESVNRGGYVSVMAEGRTSSQLNSRPSNGEDKAALMSLRFSWVSVREVCSGRNSPGFFFPCSVRL